MHKNPQNPLKTKEKQFFQARIMFALSVVIISQTLKSFRSSYATISHQDNEELYEK